MRLRREAAGREAVGRGAGAGGRPCPTRGARSTRAFVRTMRIVRQSTTVEPPVAVQSHRQISPIGSYVPHSFLWLLVVAVSLLGYSPRTEAHFERVLYSRSAGCGSRSDPVSVVFIGRNAIPGFIQDMAALRGYFGVEGAHQWFSFDQHNSCATDEAQIADHVCTLPHDICNRWHARLKRNPDLDNKGRWETFATPHRDVVSITNHTHCIPPHGFTRGREWLSDAFCNFEQHWSWWGNNRPTYHCGRPRRNDGWVVWINLDRPKKDGCLTASTSISPGSTHGVCGDGVIDEGSEDCDPPGSACPGGAITCSPQCTCPNLPPPSCGDGQVNQDNEECDPPGSACPGGQVCAGDCTCPPPPPPPPPSHSCVIECADHNGGAFMVTDFQQCRASFACGTGWNGVYGVGSQPLGDCGLRSIIYDGTFRNTDGSLRSGPFPTYDCAKCAKRTIYHRATGDNPFPAYPNDCIGLSRTWANNYCNEPGKDRGSLEGWLVGDCAQ
jgi:hypothetical protein